MFPSHHQIAGLLFITMTVCDSDEAWLLRELEVDGHTVHSDFDGDSGRILGCLVNGAS